MKFFPYWQCQPEQIGGLIDTTKFDSSKYNSFREAVANCPKDPRTGYVVVSEELLPKQVELLFSYINDTAHKKKSGNIDPKLFLDAAEFTDEQGKNALHLAIEKQEHKIAGELIKTATPEQLFSMDSAGNTALHSAVKMDDMKTAAEIVRKEGVTPEHLLLKDDNKLTVSRYVADSLVKKYGINNNLEDFGITERAELADMAKLLKEIGKITGAKELEYEFNPIIQKVFAELNGGRNKFTVLVGNKLAASEDQARVRKRPEGWEVFQGGKGQKKNVQETSGIMNR